jgi:RimJ/RimL family protein N-acetyltransferase
MTEHFTLEGRFVRLQPMGPEHVDGLLAAASGDRCTFGFTPIPGDRPAMAAYVEKALTKRETGVQEPFVTWGVAERRIVGSTRFYDLATWNWADHSPGTDATVRRGRPDVACIGYTWLEPSAQRTPVNTEAKLLMMGHAFDEWEVQVVRIQTDARNARSRRAIERLGCALDGVIRAERPAADGGVRDSAVYSMLRGEWPVHRQQLIDRLQG